MQQGVECRGFGRKVKTGGSMRILFVRHARAEERADFRGRNDLLRPLTPAGRQEAAKAFKRIARVYPKPDAILSSKAVRAVETAEILARAFGKKKVGQTALLNPGCGAAQLKKILAGLDASAEWVALVGHDPDFSILVSELTSERGLRLDFKKAACAEVELADNLRGELKAFIPPRLA